MRSLLVASLLMLKPFVVFANCNFNNSNDILDLVKKNHPEIMKNHFKKLMVEDSVNISQQRPNPELNLEYVNNENRSSKFSIMNTFEFGGKRDIRKDQSLALAQKVKWDIKDENEDFIIDSILKLYRLGQVFDLIPIYKESIGAFKRIIAVKSNRKNLSPEEEVEKETLSMAISDYLLKISRLESEKNYLIRHLSFFIGQNCNITRKALPIYSFEKTQNFVNGESNESAKVNAARANLSLANLELSTTQSEKYPDIKIGPVVELENNSKSFGVALTMDLPVFNSSKTKKQIGQYFINQASLKVKNLMKESELDKLAWIQKLNNFNDSLKSISSKDDLSQKHQKLEKLIERGVLSTAMVLESHRQLVEFTNTRFEFELGAVEAIWNIYKLNSTVLNNKL